MRGTVAALLGCLVLTGCASDWQAEVTYEVTKVYDYKMSAGSDPVKRAQLELSGSAPSGVLAKDSLSPQTVDLADISGSAEVGDKVTCTAKQHSRGATQTNPVQTELSGCRKA
ncbi:hypothetical protein [Nocardia sp. NRRL S-836]|uniref:hypothetical protein n=1 Tax=Nocardia sp. NRRL S-836 TaxID=1519492 RepID=UPI0006B066CA|nr:hypothetical protein [Nocardia sp. NRRL S-836]KOV75502.1 hypothetical protein ADL03_44460 [Nocardia sp. NRRL S-836]